MRERKEPEEIDLIAQAATYADFAVESARRAITEGLRGGISEAEVLAQALKQVAARMYSDFKTQSPVLSCRGTVHAGKRSAFPHGLPTEQQLQPGDTVITGFGGIVGGYHAESACSFVVGEPTTQQAKWLETVMLVREVAKRELKPGVPCGDVDNKAQNVIKEAGFGAYIRHRLGHGLGLNNHELPWVASAYRSVLAKGMVVSSEPGIYVPGQGGVRLIDTFLITPEGNRLLNNYLDNVGDCTIPV